MWPFSRKKRRASVSQKIKRAWTIWLVARYFGFSAPAIILGIILANFGIDPAWFGLKQPDPKAHILKKVDEFLTGPSKSKSQTDPELELPPINVANKPGKQPPRTDSSDTGSGLLLPPSTNAGTQPASKKPNSQPPSNKSSPQNSSRPNNPAPDFGPFRE